MSTSEILSLISTISFVIAVVSFVLAIVFWFSFNIPAVIGDLSGRTAKKSIARMRASNEKAGGQGYKPSAANVSRGKLTDTMKHSAKLPAAPKKGSVAEPGNLMPETGILAANKAEAITLQQTVLLEDAQATGLLADEDATVLLNEEAKPQVKRTGGKKLTMLDDVMLIHTNEVIH